jgi:hypothetical protein
MLDSKEPNEEMGRKLYSYLNIYSNGFRVDLDGYSWKRTSEIIKNLCQTVPVEDVAVTRDTYKNKHYHLHITLASPVPIYYALALRALCHDDQKRLALDYTRLLSGNMEDYDWLATSKGRIKNGKFIEEIARYRCKPQRFITPLMSRKS